MVRLKQWILATLCGLLAVGCGPDGTENDEPKPTQKLEAPAGLTLSETTTSSLTFVWEAVEGAVGYTYKYKDADGKLYVTEDTEQTTAIVEGLSAGKEYFFAVRANSSSEGGTYTPWRHLHPLAVGLHIGDREWRRHPYPTQSGRRQFAMAVP